MGVDASNTAKVSTDPVAASVSADVHAKSKAIIYSFISVEANHSMKAAQYKEESPPHGSAMMDFFKAPYSVYLNRDFILMIIKSTKLSIQ